MAHAEMERRVAVNERDLLRVHFSYIQRFCRALGAIRVFRRDVEYLNGRCMHSSLSSGDLRYAEDIESSQASMIVFLATTL